MNLFLLNNRTNDDYENYNTEKIFKKCVFDDESWNELKQIFDLFDTFGNETIQISKFFKKLKNIKFKNLIEQDVICFPNLKRSYSLKKILFELENKKKIGQEYYSWLEIKELIENFTHIKGPTIDTISKENIAQGIITPFSNSFMLKEEILTQFKEIYERCPKYCSHFVKVAQFCSEIYECFENK